VGREVFAESDKRETYNPETSVIEDFVRIIRILGLVAVMSGTWLYGGIAPLGRTAKASAVSADMQLERRQEKTPEEKQFERDRVKAMNKERQEKLKNDTDKLLQLATELKEYVDKTNENILSLDVIKKTDEIERLTKSIREKMKTAYQTEEEGPLRPR
jgi:hypothetical protein